MEMSLETSSSNSSRVYFHAYYEQASEGCVRNYAIPIDRNQTVKTFAPALADVLMVSGNEKTR